MYRARMPFRITAFLFPAITLLFMSACRRNPTGPVDTRPQLTSAQYGAIVLKLTDYDVVQITHQAGLDLRSSSIVRVEVGVKNSGGFADLLSSTPVYDATAKSYIMHFDFTVRLDSSRIVSPLTIRYVSADSSFSDVDTTVALYKYPYASAQVFANTTALGNSVFPIQGISVSGSTLYYHPMDYGLYACDLDSRSCSLRWNGYYGGSHIAADSNFVFCDINHTQIARFNLTSNTAQAPLPDLGTIYSIDGMAFENHRLYVLVYGTSATYLGAFTLNGVLVDSIPYPSNDSYFMAMNDSVVYCKDESAVAGAYQISRFDLRTKTFLPNLLSPAKAVEGIAIDNGKFYYYDMWKNFMGVVPLADLTPLPTTQ